MVSVKLTNFKEEMKKQAEENKMPEKREVMIWTGFKWTLEEGQTVEDLLDAYHDGGITSYATRYDKITDLEGKTLLEHEH